MDCCSVAGSDRASNLGLLESRECDPSSVGLQGRGRL